MANKADNAMDRIADKIPDRVKIVASEEAKQIRTLATQAAKSGAYLYPLRGIIYFISHSSLTRPLLRKLIPTVSLGLGITIFMFIFTYVPQMAMLAFTQGPIAAIGAALLVLSESSALFTFLSRALLIDEALTDTFDGTLMSRNTINLVSQGRQIQAGGDPMAKLGKLIKKPFAKFSPNAIIRYFMYLPLNFIPVVGTLMFVVLQGRRVGPVAHERYFQLKGWNAAQKERYIEQNKAAYTSFGVVATVLEMVPVASILFSFTNTVGAALWAADMEKALTTEQGTSPNLVEQAKKAE